MNCRQSIGAGELPTEDCLTANCRAENCSPVNCPAENCLTGNCRRRIVADELPMENCRDSFITHNICRTHKRTPIIWENDESRQKLGGPYTSRLNFFPR